MRLFLSIFLFCFSLNAFAELPACKGDDFSRWSNCKANYYWSEGDHYVGSWINGKRTGFGIYTWKSGEKYVGEWKNNLRHGEGTNYFTNGDIYEGQWLNNNQNGSGTYIFGINSEWPGDKYVGEHKDNLRHGQGTYTFNNGEKQVGEWKFGKLNGYATIYNPDGSIAQKGYYENNILVRDTIKDNNIANNNSILPPCPSDQDAVWNNCFGTMNFDDDEKYVGEWNNNKRNGLGTFTFANGDKYFGKYKDNEKHGHGTYTFKSGEKHIGEYKFGKLNGFATIYKPDGSIFQQGYFENDILVQDTSKGNNLVNKNSNLIPCPNDNESDWDNCFGTFNFENGDKYEGQWKKNKRNGQGTYTFGPNSEWASDIYVGEFKNNELHGLGTYTFGPNSESAGDKYVGEFKNGQINGQGTYTWVNGDKYIGEYKDDLRHGQGTYTFNNGKKQIGTWKDNELNGFATVYNPDGSIDMQGYFKDNILVQETTKNNHVAENTNKPKDNKDELIPIASGTGFAVTDKGHLVTNNHVIDGCVAVKLSASGKMIPIDILAYDQINDLAILKADFKPTNVLTISNEDAGILQEIFVAGYPFGHEISSSIKFTQGIVSSLSGIGNNYSNIQIDAAIQPGNSGGPIVDEKGNVVGVAVAKLDIKPILENFGVIPENTNFGIKSNIVRNLLRSNNINIPNENQSKISKTELGRKVTDATYYLSCLSTVAEVEKIKNKKVMFKNIFE